MRLIFAFFISALILGLLLNAWRLKFCTALMTSGSARTACICGSFCSSIIVLINPGLLTMFDLIESIADFVEDEPGAEALPEPADPPGACEPIGTILRTSLSTVQLNSSHGVSTDLVHAILHRLDVTTNSASILEDDFLCRERIERQQDGKKTATLGLTTISFYELLKKYTPTLFHCRGP